MGTMSHTVGRLPCVINSKGHKSCEKIGDMVVKYRLSTPTESLIWDVDGFSFQLLRTAGEPNKIYKDELLKVVLAILTHLPAKTIRS